MAILRALFRLLTWTLVALGVVVGIGLALLFTQDLKQYLAPTLATTMSDVLGRGVIVEGAVRVGVWRRGPSLIVHDVRLANVDWGSKPHMLTVGRLELRAPLLPLLSRHLRVDALVLEDVDALVETDYSGQTNRPRPGRMRVQNGLLAELILEGPQWVSVKDAYLVYRTAGDGVGLEIAVERATVRRVTDGLRIEALGAYRNALIAVEGTLADPMALIEGRATPIDAAAALGGTTILASGMVGSPTRGVGVRLRLDGAGPDLRDLAGLAGIRRASADGPLAFTIMFQADANGGVLEELSARLGDSTIVGSASYRLPSQGQGLRVEGVFASDTLELSSLAGEWGSLIDRAAVLQTPIPIDYWRAADIDLSYQAQAVKLGEAVIDEVDVGVLLRDGIFTLFPFIVSVGGVPFNAEVAGDLTGPRPRAELRAETHGFPLGLVLNRSGLAHWAVGDLDLVIDLSGEGDHLQGVLGGLKGDSVVAFGPGYLEPDYVKRLPEVVRDRLLSLGEGETSAELSCVRLALSFGESKTGQSIGETSEFLFETALSRTLGGGRVDLVSGQLDGYLIPRAKAGPEKDTEITPNLDIQISGTLPAPSFMAVEPDAALAKHYATPARRSARACAEPAGRVEPLVPTREVVDALTRADVSAGSRDGEARDGLLDRPDTVFEERLTDQPKGSPR